MKLTITRSSRIGFSWSCSAEQRATRCNQTRPEVRDPGGRPMGNGLVRAVYAEYLRVARVNRANAWTCRWFVKHHGKWVEVNMDVDGLCLLLNSNPTGKASPRTNSVTVETIAP